MVLSELLRYPHKVNGGRGYQRTISLDEITPFLKDSTSGWTVGKYM